MVAASSYQNDGRAAPPRLIAAARTPTISGSRQGAAPGWGRDSLNTPLCCQKRPRAWSVVQPHVPEAVVAEAARVVRVQMVVARQFDMRSVGQTTGLARIIAVDLYLVGVGHTHPNGHQPTECHQAGSEK